MATTQNLFDAGLNLQTASKFNESAFKKGERGERVIQKLLEEQGYKVNPHPEELSGKYSVVDFEVIDGKGNVSYAEAKVRKPVTLNNGYSAYTILKSSVEKYQQFGQPIDIYIVDVEKSVIRKQFFSKLMEGGKRGFAIFPCKFSYTDAETGEIKEDQLAFGISQFETVVNLPPEYCKYVADDTEQTPFPITRISGDYMSRINTFTEDTAERKVEFIRLYGTLKFCKTLQTPNNEPLPIFTDGNREFVKWGDLVKSIGLLGSTGITGSAYIAQAVQQLKLPVYLIGHTQHIDFSDVPKLLSATINFPRQKKFGKSVVYRQKAELLLQSLSNNDFKTVTPSQPVASAPRPAKVTPAPAADLDLNRVQRAKEFFISQGDSPKDALIMALNIEQQRTGKVTPALIEFAKMFC